MLMLRSSLALTAGVVFGAVCLILGSGIECYTTSPCLHAFMYASACAPPPTYAVSARQLYVRMVPPSVPQCYLCIFTQSCYICIRTGHSPDAVDTPLHPLRSAASLDGTPHQKIGVSWPLSLPAPSCASFRGFDQNVHEKWRPYRWISRRQCAFLHWRVTLPHLCELLEGFSPSVVCISQLCTASSYLVFVRVCVRPELQVKRGPRRNTVTCSQGQGCSFSPHTPPS